MEAHINSDWFIINGGVGLNHPAPLFSIMKNSLGNSKSPSQEAYLYAHKLERYVGDKIGTVSAINHYYDNYIRGATMVTERCPRTPYMEYVTQVRKYRDDNEKDYYKGASEWWLKSIGKGHLFSKSHREVEITYQPTEVFAVEKKPVFIEQTYDTWKKEDERKNKEREQWSSWVREKEQLQGLMHMPNTQRQIDYIRGKIREVNIKLGMI